MDLDQKKTNTLLNLINEQEDIDKTYLHTKDLSEPEYEYLIKNRENAGIKHLNEANAFIKCSNTMDDVYEVYRKCTREPFNFLTIDTTLPSNNPLRFRKNLFDTL